MDLSTKEAGRLLNCSQHNVIKMINQGRLSADKVNGVWRVPMSEIPRWFSAAKTEKQSNACRILWKMVMVEGQLTIGQACRVLGISRQRLHQLIGAGRVKATRPEGFKYMFVSASEVRRLLRSRS